MLKQLLPDDLSTLPADGSADLALKLKANLNSEVEKFLADKEFVFELVRGFGSPLNILLPDLLQDNVHAFQKILKSYFLSGKIFFAHKTNRSDSILKRLSLEDVGIDVASAAELKHALACGFAAERIEATGPKNAEFLALALSHNIVINIDSIVELEEIIRLKEKYNYSSRTQILLRLSDFGNNSRYSNKTSRFGICSWEIDDALNLILQSKKINLLGLAFHLDTVSLLEKAAAIEVCLEIFERAIAIGLQPSILNIGGGFKLNYLAYQSDWDAYTTALREAVLGHRRPITWQNNSFGLKAEKNALRGGLNIYSYYDSLTGAQFLEALLKQNLPNRNNAQIGNFLRDNGIQLWLEPGRSLVNQVGLTVGRVISIRKSSQGENLVCLEMKRQDLCFLDQEFFVDPIILYKNPGNIDLVSPMAVYFAGNLCLESDVIYRHQTFVDKLPQTGDLVVFPNTAGYFMDFSASESIMQPVASKVTVYKDNGRFIWARDENYLPWSVGGF